MLLGGESRGVRLPITRRWRPLWLGSSLPSTTYRVYPRPLLSCRYYPRNTPDITTLTWGGEGWNPSVTPSRIVEGEALTGASHDSLTTKSAGDYIIRE